MSKINVLSRTRAEVESDCKIWADDISRSFKPDIIVFIAKSGFLFAKPMAEYFNVPMVGIKVRRPSNDGKDRIRKYIPWIPKWLLFALLRSKASYGYNEKNSNREVDINEKLENGVGWENYKDVLIVDDSTDTGFSLLKAKEAVQSMAHESRVMTASYCVIDISEVRVKVDYWRYKNTIVFSATSRYSRENGEFMRSIIEWKRDGGIM